MLQNYKVSDFSQKSTRILRFFTDFFYFSGKDLAIWICSDDELVNLDIECSVISDSKKPPGYYIVRPSGLFPAPLPQDSDICAKASKYFWFLGVFLAKTLQDNRLVDLPLSNPLLKLICQGEISRQVKKQSDELMVSSMISVLSEESTDLDSSGGSTFTEDSWYSDILSIDDLDTPCITCVEGGCQKH